VGNTDAAVRAYLGLGSNRGDREAYLSAALAALAATPGVRVVRCTPFRASAPWGDPDQPPFLNAVAAIETTLAAEPLLAVVKAIEQRLGRQPSRRWGPREIDIDLLTWGRRRLQTTGLTLPHPRILDRPFVWEPLAELDPDLVKELRADATLSL
jgi:2-amino-4-hydroxy-6-hydroxymethyldihydropteridine diphosphokinase